jgi:hypothetical protein
VNINRHRERVLAIDIRASRFAFVVLGGPEQLLDWGLKHFRRGVNAVKIPPEDKIAALLQEFSPNTIVLKESAAHFNRKRASMRIAILRQAQKGGIPVCLPTSGEIKRAFPDYAVNKYRIASAVVMRFPELTYKLPGRRKIWKPEDHRMSIFDAAAAGITYFAQPKMEQDQ